jgi:uncharacterized membrane protein YedE/YeeE
LKILSAFIASLIFGIGLIIAGMSNPAKVLGFLDIAGQWDPSLALVMVGAIGVSLPIFLLANRRKKAVFGDSIEVPANNRIDIRLIGGSLIFGIGWGLAGICPGPAFVLLGFGITRAWIFIALLFAGLWLARLLQSARPIKSHAISGTGHAV